jgi:plastocyanin
LPNQRLALAAALAVGFAACAPHPGPTRNITLVARGLTFMSADEAASENPTIAMQPGERIRLILRNEAPGLLHSVVIPAWNVELDAIRAGETSEVTFVVPQTPGGFEYHCGPHPNRMHGRILVAH